MKSGYQRFSKPYDKDEFYACTENFIRNEQFQQLYDNARDILQLCRNQGNEIKKINEELTKLKSSIETAVKEIEKTRDTKKHFEENK